MSEHAKELTGEIENLSGKFTPDIVIEVLREQNEHVMADLIEGLVDEINRLKAQQTKPRKSKRRKR